MPKSTADETFSHHYLII